MFLAFPLGAVFGGTLVGQLVNSAGYHAMFVVLGAVWAILPAIGIFKLKIGSDFSPARTPAAQPATARLGATFLSGSGDDAAGFHRHQYRAAGHRAVDAGAGLFGQCDFQHGHGQRSADHSNRAAHRRVVRSVGTQDVLDAGQRDGWRRRVAAGLRHRLVDVLDSGDAGAGCACAPTERWPRHW